MTSAPAAELEPGALVRPAADPGDQNADVAHQVAEVDQAGRADRRGCAGLSVTRNGIAAMTPTATAALAGVLNIELTWPQTLPSGIRRSRPIENISRAVAPWIAVRADEDGEQGSRTGRPCRTCRRGRP